jgi:hypothetical protein
MTPGEFALGVLDLEEEVRHLRRANARMEEELNEYRDRDRKLFESNMANIGNILNLLVNKEK